MTARTGPAAAVSPDWPPSGVPAPVDPSSPPAPAGAAPVPGIPADVQHALHPHGLLLTAVPGAVLLGAAALVGGILVWRGRRRRRRGLPRRTGRTAAGATVVVLLLTLSVAAFVNAYAGYLPTTGAVLQAAGLQQPAGGGHGRGRVVTAAVGDPALQVPPAATYVYLPPGYDTTGERRYPSVYLIHGHPGTSADWFRAGRIPQIMDTLIAARVVPPEIVVAPDVTAGSPLQDLHCRDIPGGPQLGTYLTRTVVDYVDAHYRTLRSWHSRGIGGMSSGGYCAIGLGLHHQDRFGAILALEPGGDATGVLTPLQTPASSGRPGLLHPMPIFVDVGGVSRPVDAKNVADAFRARGQTVAWRVEAGQTHTWKEARAGIPYALAFASQHLYTDPTAGPQPAPAGHPDVRR